MIRTLPCSADQTVALWAHANNPASKTNMSGYEHMTWQEAMLEAARAWRSYSPHMYLGCRDYHAREFFDWFLPQAPSGLKVTGGIQSPMALQGIGLPGVDCASGVYDLYDARKWKLVAAHAMAIAAWTNNSTVLFDGEGPFSPFHAGECTIKVAHNPHFVETILGLNMPKLREAIKPLANSDVKWLFYFPGVLENTTNFPDRYDVTIRLVEVFAEAIPNSTFMETRLARPQYRAYAMSVKCATEMARILGDRVHTRILCTASGKNGNKQCYTPSDIKWVLASTSYKVSVYPGIRDLIPTAEAFKTMAEGA